MFMIQGHNYEVQQFLLWPNGYYLHSLPTYVRSDSLIIVTYLCEYWEKMYYLCSLSKTYNYIYSAHYTCCQCDNLIIEHVCKHAGVNHVYTLL